MTLSLQMMPQNTHRFSLFSQLISVFAITILVVVPFVVSLIVV